MHTITLPPATVARRHRRLARAAGILFGSVLALALLVAGPVGAVAGPDGQDQGDLAPDALDDAGASADDDAPAPDDSTDDDEQHRLTWGISPAGAERRDTRSLIDHVVDPGTTLTDHVVIDNYGDEPLALDLYTSDARPANGGFDVATADEAIEAVGAWVELSETAVEIPPRDHVVVELTISVPETVEPGDYAGGVLASRRTVDVSSDLGFETERRVGTRVHLRVAGPIDPALDVTELQAAFDTPLNPVAQGGLAVDYRVENTGNVRLGSTTAVTLRGPFGLGSRTVAGPPIEDLLPGHWVHQQLTIPDLRPLGRYHVEVEVEPTHSIDQTLGESVAPASATTTAWALPYTTIVLVLALGLLAWWARRRRRVRRPVPPPEAAVGAAEEPAGSDPASAGRRP